MFGIPYMWFGDIMCWYFVYISTAFGCKQFGLLYLVCMWQAEQNSIGSTARSARIRLPATSEVCSHFFIYFDYLLFSSVRQVALAREGAIRGLPSMVSVW